MTETPTSNCPNCGDPLLERYCPKCGEKRYDAHSLTVGHIVEETLEGLFHFDNKFFRTLKLLIARPGQLSLDYVEGRRMGAVRPLPLFLIINIIAFLLLFFNPFSLPLKNYTTYAPFINYNTLELWEAKVLELGTTDMELTKRFDEAMHRTSKTWLILFIPAYAILFGALFLPKRRKLVEHLVFATHYLSFVLIAFMLTMLLVLPIEMLASSAGLGGSSDVFDVTAAIVIALTLILHLYNAIKRFYKVPFSYALITAMVGGAGFVLILQVYRMFLFFFVMHGLD